MSSENAPFYCSLRALDPDDKKDVVAVANLHRELLDWGEMAGLGKLFLERFCYRTLVKDGLMQVSLYEINGRPVGFIAYTAHSLSFHRRALRKHFFYLAFLLFISIMREPSTIRHLLRALRLIRSRRSEINHRKCGAAEILAIGVLPEYRSLSFYQRTGLRISVELLKSAVSFFKRIGLKKVDVFVDAFNTQALLFYKNFGPIVRPYTRAGVSMYQVTLDLNHSDLQI